MTIILIALIYEWHNERKLVENDVELHEMRTTYGWMITAVIMLKAVILSFKFISGGAQ